MNPNPMGMMAGAAVNALRKTTPEASMAPPAAGPNPMAARMMQGRQGKNVQQPSMPMMGGGIPNGMNMRRPNMGVSAKSVAPRAPNVGRFDVGNI